MDKLKHWTEKTTKAFISRISSDFVAQLENRLQRNGESYTQLADRIGVTPSRVSQVLNSPGNLTLKNLVRYARALGMKVAIVAYADDDPDNNNGPVNSEIFRACWNHMGAPTNFFELSQAIMPIRSLEYDKYASTNDSYKEFVVNSPVKLTQTALTRLN